MIQNTKQQDQDKVILTIDEGDERDSQESHEIPRANSYMFGKDDPDPPTRLIENFLQRQRESGDFHLDPDVDDVTFWESPRQAAKLSSGLRSRRASLSRESSPRKLPSRAASLCKSRLMETGNVRESEEDPLELDIPEEKFAHREGWSWWVLLEWGFLILSIATLVCTSTIHALERRRLLGLELWRWAVLGFVVLCGRLLSEWIIRLSVFFIERNFILRKRLVYFVYGLQRGVQKCLWFGIILLTWRLLFNPNLPLPIRKERKVLQSVTKILVCLLVAASVWLIKILLVKVLALNFHVNTYFDRIQESLFNQYILEALSGPPLLDENVQLMPQVEKTTQTTKSSPLGRKSGLQNLKKSGENDPRKSQMLQNPKKSGETGISILDLQKLNQKNVSAWNMKRLIRLAKSSKITTLAQNYGDEDCSDDNKNGMETEWQAKSTAKHIFKNVARPGCCYLTLIDLMRFIGDEECVMKAFALFDGAMENGRITKQALVNWVTNVFREKRALSFSLNDTKTAVNKLHRIIDCIVGVIILVIWLLILGIATTHLLVALSSQLVLAVFVFGNTCKTVFEAIIFLFVMHPFDVGDRCVVDGVQMVVEEMNILSTVFLRYDNEKIYYPNSVLATKPISNFYRSPDMGDAIDFTIHLSTSNEKIESLKAKVKKYIDSHLDHWYPKHDIVMKEIEDMNRVRMAIWLQHTMNHQNAGEKWIRRSHLLMYLKDVFQELDIDYRLLPQEVHLRNLG